MKHLVFGGGVVLIAALSLVGGLLLRSPTPVEEDEGRRVVREAARKTTALAAIFTAAAQLADADELATFEKHGIVLPSDLPWLSEIEARFPERRALVRAVDWWPEARKRAALEWLIENTTWSTMLHAMAIESFDDQLKPREWGPSLSVYAPEIHARRASLAPLLEEALEDEAIRRIAEQVAVQEEPFTPEGIQQRRDALVRYLRFEEELPEFHAFRAPLMNSGGVNAVLPDGSILMVVGAPGDAPLTLTHEMAHQPVYRILSKPLSEAALAASACAFSTVERDYGYSTWGSYFAETLVRSLSVRLEGREPANSDFPFERYVTEMLEQWEASDRPFDEAVAFILHGLRERFCEAGEVAAATCPSPSLRLPSGACLVLPEGAGRDLPVAIYLHGMTPDPVFAWRAGLHLAAAARDRLAVLIPLGAKGECAWSPAVEGNLCWPYMPNRDEAVRALVESLQADLDELRRRLARAEPISPFLVGFSNGGYGAIRIAATTEMPLAGLAVLHAGGDDFVRSGRTFPSLLIAARDDPFHFATMQTLRKNMSAAGWPHVWKEREGGHEQADADVEAVVEFILENARGGSQ